MTDKLNIEDIVPNLEYSHLRKKQIDPALID